MLERLPPEERAGNRGAALAARIGRALGRLGRLLEDHFLAERLRAGGFPLHREPVGLAGCLEGPAATSAVPVRLELGSEAAARILADPALLGRAIERLLAAAGREVEAVLVSASSRGPEVCLRFSGARVGPAALARPSRGSPSDPSGQALGLVLAGEVARAHGGSLAVDGGSLQLLWPRAAP
jgi:signal transduction histidine kinase